jgi:hypothetical protein
MPQHSPIDQRAAGFATASQRDLAQLRASLKKLQDSGAGLRRALHVPVPKGGRRSTRGVRNSPDLFERAGLNAFGGFLGHGLTDDLGLGSGSFYASGPQNASLWSDILQLGQRVL